MRSLRDRICHVLLFELLLIVVCTPILSAFMDEDAAVVGMLAIGLSVAAMLCNLGFNYAFDRLLGVLGRPLYPRSFLLRLVHSVSFELVLMLVTVPLVMVWMGCSFLQALALDLGFALFVPVYALGFNWSYDRVFPPPAMRHP